MRVTGSVRRLPFPFIWLFLVFETLFTLTLNHLLNVLVCDALLAPHDLPEDLLLNGASVVRIKYPEHLQKTFLIRLCSPLN